MNTIAEVDLRWILPIFFLLGTGFGWIVCRATYNQYFTKRDMRNFTQYIGEKYDINDLKDVQNFRETMHGFISFREMSIKVDRMFSEPWYTSFFKKQ